MVVSRFIASQEYGLSLPLILFDYDHRSITTLMSPLSHHTEKLIELLRNLSPSCSKAHIRLNSSLPNGNWCCLCHLQQSFQGKKKKEEKKTITFFSLAGVEKKREENGMRNRKHGLPQNFDEINLFQEYIVLKPDTLEEVWTSDCVRFSRESVWVRSARATTM